MTNARAWITSIGFMCGVVSTDAIALNPIVIGLIGELTGADAQLGTYQLNGIKLAIKEINSGGGVLGRSLEIAVEDNQSGNPGSELAMSRLAGRGDITAVISSIRSTQVLTMLPAVLKAGIPVVVGGTDYTLTHANNPWVFRGRPHDGYSARAIADFGVNTLKLKRWVIVHSTEAFGVGGKQRLTAALKNLGIESIVALGVRDHTQDVTFTMQAIKKADADVISTYIATEDNLIAFANPLRHAGIALPWVGSSSLGTPTVAERGGDVLYGTYSITDFAPEANPEAQAFAKKYMDRYRLPADIYSGWSYDAVNIIALAIRNANSTKPDAIRKAILAIQGYRGVEGTYRYDQYGDGLHHYNIVKNDHGKIVFVKHVEFFP